MNHAWKNGASFACKKCQYLYGLPFHTAPRCPKCGDANSQKTTGGEIKRFWLATSALALMLIFGLWFWAVPQFWFDLFALFRETYAD